MSQAGALNATGGGSGNVQTLTGNSGGAVSPTANNINTLGTGSITIVGSPGTSTLTTQLTGLTNHNVLIGAGTATITNVAPSATSGVPLISQGASADPTFGTAVVSGGGTGATTLTNHGVLLGQGTSAVVATGVGATGTVLAGNTGADPTFQTIATLGGITTITGNTGGAESPSAGNFNILGTGSITVAGSANTETVQLTGLTNHNVLVGAGTATITKVAPAATSGVPLISQGAAADPTFGTAVVAGGGTGDTSFTAYSVICGGTTSTGALQNVSGLGSSGEVLTSNGASMLPTWQPASGGSGITTLDGDTGSATGATVTIETNVAGVLAGSTVLFTGSGATLTYSNTDADSNIFEGKFAGSGASGNTDCTAIGVAAGSSSTNNIRCDFIGESAGDTCSSNAACSYLGSFSGNNCTGCDGAVMIGNGCGSGSTSVAQSSYLGQNCGVGSTTVSESVFAGFNAATSALNISNSVFIGARVANNSASGTDNSVLIGASTVQTPGSFVTAIGGHAGTSCTGSDNIFIGYQSAVNYAGTENSNIIIGNGGTAAENNVIRIGTQGSSTAQQNTCYIAGITGVTVSNSAAVLIDTTTGQLGTVVSSLRYKSHVQDMDSYSQEIMKLRPVSYVYKSDVNMQTQFGLIAEEVNEVMPNLVVYDKEGLPESVKYHELPIFLLAEIQKLRKEINALKGIT
jgi:hypothetical protein